MPIWRSRPVTEEPEIVLVRWAIYRIKDDELHFVGVRADESSGRVSSAIVRFDVARRVGVTRSGRVYSLTGRQGTDATARYVWDAWCQINGVTTSADVTSDVLREDAARR
ncbi:hypothetical protein PTE30175_03579 [Pandoraea terrae]|uniref:Uncharacterized protein n=1 Tax=Pandoraea terrae TaxID=1537710 RepID=A0A5E4X588_9BURK|nr:hypothetical protein [Pandoraea terrae]VVE31521.1 hypothetical protein PTE30175_03579 [Pandoraea terrae]